MAYSDPLVGGFSPPPSSLLWGLPLAKHSESLGAGGEHFEAVAVGQLWDTEGVKPGWGLCPGCPRTILALPPALGLMLTVAHVALKVLQFGQ